VRAYSLEEFKEELKNSDLVYGTVSLNAAVRVPVRVRKKALFKLLEDIPDGSWAKEFVVFAETGVSPKGNKTIKLV